MPLLYADTSAVIRAYLSDEDDHAPLNRLLLVGNDPVVTSELTHVEFTSAIAAAHRAGRISNPDAILADFESECGEYGAFSLLAFDSATILPMARQLVLDNPLRAMDAIHLATALIEAVSLAGGEATALVTRDNRQAAAAKVCGLRVL